MVEEKGFLEGLQNLERVTADLPLDEMLIWMARGAIELMDENREFVRLIIMEGLGGDEAGLDQYRRLLDLWESALSTVLGRYQEKGELPGNSLRSLSRQIIYVIHMAFVDSLLGRNVSPTASTAERREALAVFAESGIRTIVRGVSSSGR